MRAEEFIDRLRFAMPSAEVLGGYGLDEQEVQEIQDGFRVSSRSEPEQSANDVGEIGRLLGLYDCTSLEVGLVRFDAKVTTIYGGHRFGACEADPLAVKPSGAVVMYDHAISGAEVVRCAADPERFLDALAEFLQVRSEKDVWKGRATQAAERCRIASGEPSSFPFYQMLCGFLGG